MVGSEVWLEASTLFAIIYDGPFRSVLKTDSPHGQKIPPGAAHNVPTIKTERALYVGSSLRRNCPSPCGVPAPQDSRSRHHQRVDVGSWIQLFHRFRRTTKIGPRSSSDIDRFALCERPSGFMQTFTGHPADDCRCPGCLMPLKTPTLMQISFFRRLPSWTRGANWSDVHHSHVSGISG